MDEYLKNLGFVDITKEYPIKFIECLPISFEIIYPVSKRFKRVNQGITTFILIGNEHNFVSGYIDSYYKNSWSRFYLTTTEKYVKEYLLSGINANERKVLNLLEYNTDTSARHSL